MLFNTGGALKYLDVLILTRTPRPPSCTRCRRGGDMFGVIGWIVFGLIVGAIAKLLMPGRDPGGIIVTMLLGIAGALIGGIIGRALGLVRTERRRRLPDVAAGLDHCCCGCTE